jgi:hypothetical protein
MEENDAKRTSLIEPQAFIIAEYSALRREIELEIKEIGEYLRYAVVSSGAIWAWLLLKSQPQISRIGCMLPFVLSTLLLVQTVVLRKKIFILAKYIARIEQSFDLPDGLGWETQLASGGIKRDNVPHWENTIWGLLCVGNLVLALLVMWFL